MTHERGLTRERIDELLRFLPRLEVPGRSWYRASASMGGSGDPPPGPHPEYAPDIVAFFGVAGQPWWSDYGYAPHSAQRALASDDEIAAADLDGIKTLLTVCVRGERFCGGWWARILDEGRVQAVLRRLAELRDELA